MMNIKHLLFGTAAVFSLFMYSALAFMTNPSLSWSKYLHDDGQVRQLYLCYFVSDELQVPETSKRFLMAADYQARILGWSNTDLAFYKGYTLGKHEDKLKGERAELVVAYKNMGCDLLIHRPIVTRDQ